MALNVNINVQTESLRSTDNQVRQAQRHNLSRKTDQAKTTEKASRLILPQSQQNPKTPPNARPSAPSTTNPKSPTNSSGSSLILTPTASSYASPIQRPQRVSQQLSARRKGGKLEGARYVKEARAGEQYLYQTPGRYYFINPGFYDSTEYIGSGGPYGDSYIRFKGDDPYTLEPAGSASSTTDLYKEGAKHPSDYTIQGWFNLTNWQNLVNEAYSEILYLDYVYGELREYTNFQGKPYTAWDYTGVFLCTIGEGAHLDYSFFVDFGIPRNQYGIFVYGYTDFFGDQEVLAWYKSIDPLEGWHHIRASHIGEKLIFLLDDERIPEIPGTVPSGLSFGAKAKIDYWYNLSTYPFLEVGQFVLSTGEYAKIDANNPTSQRSNRIREVRP